MKFRLLTAELVEVIHDEVINPGELTGRAGDKSLEAILARVDHRLAFGIISDAFELAAAYATAIAVGHAFNDGNKRTAHQSMDVCLDLNGIQINWKTEDIGPLIVRAAQGLVDESDLAAWLRVRADAGDF